MGEKSGVIVSLGAGRVQVPMCFAPASTEKMTSAVFGNPREQYETTQRGSSATFPPLGRNTERSFTMMGRNRKCGCFRAPLTGRMAICQLGPASTAYQTNLHRDRLSKYLPVSLEHGDLPYRKYQYMVMGRLSLITRLPCRRQHSGTIVEYHMDSMVSSGSLECVLESFRSLSPKIRT